MTIRTNCKTFHHLLFPSTVDFHSSGSLALENTDIIFVCMDLHILYILHKLYYKIHITYVCLYSHILKSMRRWVVHFISYINV